MIDTYCLCIKKTQRTFSNIKMHFAYHTQHLCPFRKVGKIFVMGFIHKELLGTCGFWDSAVNRRPPCFTTIILKKWNFNTKKKYQQQKCLSFLAKRWWWQTYSGYLIHLVAWIPLEGIWNILIGFPILIPVWYFPGHMDMRHLLSFRWNLSLSLHFGRSYSAGNDGGKLPQGPWAFLPCLFSSVWPREIQTPNTRQKSSLLSQTADNLAMFITTSSFSPEVCNSCGPNGDHKCLAFYYYYF